MNRSDQPTAQLLLPRVPERPPEPWAERPEVESIREMLLAGTLTALTTNGRGGQGKTALAQKIAWDEAVRAHFTNGVLWVRLGKNPDVMGELAQLAANFGVDVSNHATIEARKDAVRSLLFGRRCLLIIDDAWTADAAQVFWDVASGPVLLTTRVRSIAHEVAPGSLMTLGQLLPDEATKLLKRLAPNVADSPELPRIVALADGLPLTLRLLAPIVARHAAVGLGLNRILDDIESPSWRGDRLAAIVAKSLDDLSEAEQTAFGQLAVFGARPADFDSPAAAAVWDVSEDLAYSRLGTFVDRNLVDADDNKRFYLHQSVADVAATLLPTDNIASSLHANYYLTLFQRSNLGHRTLMAELSQIRRAWSALSTDSLSDLTNMVLFVLSVGKHPHNQGLGQEYIDWVRRALAALPLIWQQQWTSAETAERLKQDSSSAVALALGHSKAEGRLLNGLGVMYAHLGNYKQALECYAQALKIIEELQDRPEQASVLGNIGVAHAHFSDWRLARSCFERAFALHKSTGNLIGQASDLTNIGLVCSYVGDQRQAIAYYEQALSILEKLEDKSVMATALSGLGSAHSELGNNELALTYYHSAITLIRSVGDRGGEAQILNNMGEAHRNSGDTQRALKFLEESLLIWKEIADLSGQAQALNNIGEACRELGYYEQALKYYAESLEINQQIGNDRDRGTTLNNVGLIFEALGDDRQALAYYERALPLRESGGDSAGKAGTLYNIAAIHLREGNLPEAERLLTQVVAIDEAIEHPDLESDRMVLFGARAMRAEQTAKGNTG